jgi:GNAT superfamily N-acetyltransferase
MELCVEDNPDPRDAALLDAQVRREPAAASGHGDEMELAVLARDGGSLRAGVYDWRWGGCCELESPWVKPSLRGQGLGSRLLTAAEAVVFGYRPWISAYPSGPPASCITTNRPTDAGAIPTKVLENGSRCC